MPGVVTATLGAATDLDGVRAASPDDPSAPSRGADEAAAAGSAAPSTRAAAAREPMNGRHEAMRPRGSPLRELVEHLTVRTRQFSNGISDRTPPGGVKARGRR